MKIRTTRFGMIDCETDDVIAFSSGLFGLEDCHEWVLLADGQHDCLGWLQSVNQPETALAVVSPRRFVPDYQVRVFRREIAPLQLEDPSTAQVLVIVGKNERSITLNLKAPLLVNIERRLGRQVVHNGDQPVQHELFAPTVLLRRSA